MDAAHGGTSWRNQPATARIGAARGVDASGAGSKWRRMAMVPASMAA